MFHAFEIAEIVDEACRAARENPNGIEVAEAAALDALDDRRRREERAYRENIGNPRFLTARQYAAMNRFVDRLVEESEEAIRYSAIRAIARVNKSRS